MRDVFVWLAQHPTVWVVALGIVCSLLYRWLDRYPWAHATFRVLAAALPGDVVAIRKAVLQVMEDRLAAKAGVDPVAFAARRGPRAAPRIVTPDSSNSLPPVENTPAQFPPHWDDPDERIRRGGGRP